MSLTAAGGRAAARHPVAPALGRVLLWLAVALTLVHALRVLVPGVRLSQEADAALLASCFVVGAAAALARAAHRGWRREDVALGTGLVCYALGWVYWARFLLPLDAPPYPSPADLLWGLLYPSAILALGLQAVPGKRFRTAFWLDVAIGATGASSAVLGFGVPALVGPGEAWDVVGVNAIYLGGDVALLLLLISVLAVRRFRVPWLMWVRVVAVGSFALTDAWFLREVAATGVVPVADELNIGWTVSFALLASTVGGRMPRAVRESRSRRSVLLVPLIGTVVALGVLVAVPTGAFGARWVAAVATLFAVARMGHAFLEADALAGSRELALTDELTGLSNRRDVYLRGRRLLATGRPLTVVLLDLDGFKEVNDTLGHGAGDLLLGLVARRLVAEARRGSPVRQADVVARLGGDEFALLMTGPWDGGAAAAERVVAAVASTYVVDGVRVRVSASAGVVHAPEHGTDLDELIRRADVAMYAAKAAHLHLMEYRADLDTRSREGLRRVERLRAALVEDRLVVHVQPKVDLRTGEVTGVEALARIDDGEHGLLLPEDFLDALAQGGQLGTLTAKMLDRAVAQAGRWLDAGHRLPVAVNVPADAFVDGELPALVRDTLERHSVAGDLLVLEVTEDVLLHDREAGQATLAAVRALGVRVSIDDYGTGYSSLAYLRDLQVDELKLDRSFVAAMVGDRRATRIVESTVALAHGLDLRVVAEGVEDEAARDAVRAAGCDEGQGWYLGEPMTPDALEELLAARPGTVVAELAAESGPTHGARAPD